MNDWTSGYVADIDYTFGHYYELNPQRVKLAFLNAGLVAPEFGNACELGFGQGLSANLHAAASVYSWCGTDFIPSQVGFAQDLAAASGANAQFFDDAFLEFTQRDLPDFDFICLHGIWSWISDENRAVIVEFIRKRLKVGGVLYISYNTLPGWGAFAPMRHLMAEHGENFGSNSAGSVGRVQGALAFTEKLLATCPLYATDNPLVNERFQHLKSQNPRYLAHEYFNRNWQAFHFGEMVEWLKPAKLTYACSAHYLDHIDGINLTTDQQNFLGDIHDPMFKQTARDFMVNQAFRKDYWVKGARRLTPPEQVQGFRDQSLVMTAHRSDVTLKVTGSLGEASLSESVYAPLLDLMSDHRVRTIAQIEQDLKASGISIAQLIQMVIVLCGNGTLTAVQEDASAIKAKKHTDNLNTHLMLKARSSNDITFLASPVTGGGVGVGRFHQLFVLAMQQGKKKPEDWAVFVSQILTVQGQKIVKEGKALETPEEQLSELTTQAHEFEVKQLPILKALQIA